MRLIPFSRGEIEGLAILQKLQSLFQFFAPLLKNSDFVLIFHLCYFIIAVREKQVNYDN